MLVPCGQTVGHGESCVEGWLCEACAEISKLREDAGLCITCGGAGVDCHCEKPAKQLDLPCGHFDPDPSHCDCCGDPMCNNCWEALSGNCAKCQGAWRKSTPIDPRIANVEAQIAACMRGATNVITVPFLRSAKQGRKRSALLPRHGLDCAGDPPQAGAGRMPRHRGAHC